MWYVVVEVSRQTVTKLLILAMLGLFSLPFGFQLALHLTYSSVVLKSKHLGLIQQKE